MCATAAVNLKVPGYKGRWKAYLLIVLNGTVKKYSLQVIQTIKKWKSQGETEIKNLRNCIEFNLNQFSYPSWR